MSTGSSRPRPPSESAASAGAANDIPEWLQALKPDDEVLPALEPPAATVVVPEVASLPPSPKKEAEPAMGSLLGEDDLPAWLRALGQPSSEPAAEPPPPAETGAIPAWALNEVPTVEKEAPAQEATPMVWGQRPARPATEKANGAAIFASLTDVEVSGTPEASPVVEPVPVAASGGRSFNLLILVVVAVLLVLVLVGALMFLPR